MTPPGLATEDLYAAVVGSSFDGIITKTLNGTVLSWNPAAERIFGYLAEEMIGHTLLRLFPADRVHEEDMILSRIKRGERVEHFDTVRVRKDGTAIDVSVTISPLRNASGTIVGASKIVRDISDRIRLEHQLRQMAFFDPLTGLANRRLLEDRLGQAQLASQRYSRWAVVAYIDINNFKDINDRFGHEAGDHLLVECAHRMSANLRASDTVARLGGDEFLVLSTEMGHSERDAIEAAIWLKRRLRELLSFPLPFTEGGPPLRCSASIGTHVFHGNAATPQALISAADAAMYVEKFADSRPSPQA